jgi:hypothetical protein
LFSLYKLIFSPSTSDVGIFKPPSRPALLAWCMDINGGGLGREYLIAVSPTDLEEALIPS